MKPFLYFLLSLLTIGTLQTQSLPQPCSLQARMARSICFDPPGCRGLSPTDITGSTPPYTYLWDNGHTGTSITYFGAQATQAICHSVTITDASGCSVVLSDSLSGETLLLDITPDTIHYGSQTVNTDLSANDSTGLTDFLITQPPAYGELTINAEGIATYTPDDTWCGVDYFRYQALVDCRYTPPATCVLKRTDCSGVLTFSDDCNGACTGSAFFYDGQELPTPLTYAWSTGATTDTIRNLCAGQYGLTVTDASGQTHPHTFNVQAASIDLSIAGPTGFCLNERVQLRGEVELNGGNTTPVNYNWSLPGSNFSLAGPELTLSGGGPRSRTYRLEAVTQGGCVDSAFHDITFHPQPSVESLSSHELAYAPNTLVLEPEFESGTPPYQFLWTGPNGMYSDLPNLVWPDVSSYYDGRITLLITDSNGCRGGRSRTYAFPDSLDNNTRIGIYQPDHPICRGSELYLRFGIFNNVLARRNLDSVRWTGPNGFSTNEEEFTLENLQPENAGKYRLTAHLGPYVLTDSMQLEVSANEASIVSTELIPLTSCTTPTGGTFTINLDAPGPFRSSIWATGGSSVTAEESPVIHENLRSSYGSREVEIRTGYDDQCYIHTRIPETIGPVTTTFNVTPADCTDEGGSVTLVVDPPADRVLWSITGSNSSWDSTFTIDNVPPGWHSASRIERPQGCTLFNLPFYVPPAVAFNVVVNARPDCDNATGELEVMVEQPATGSYSVAWSDGAEGPVNANLSTGWYSVTVTDDEGCESHQNFYLPATEPCLSTISGYAYLNTDCVCAADSNYFPLSGIEICATSTDYTQCTYTNHAGAYTLVLPETGVFEITSDALSEDYLTENCSPGTVNISTLGQQVSVPAIYYCGAPVYDAAVAINCSTPRPGFEQTSTIRLRNNGVLPFDTVYLNATISPLIDVNYISPQPASFDPVTNEITWLSRTSLSHQAYLNFKVRGTVIGELGEEAVSSVSLSLNEMETVYNNNEAACHSVIVGSYDPNDKQVFPNGVGESGTLAPADSLLNYTIRFQNTGTDTAFTVIVRDTLDRETFDLNSFRFTASSHPVTINIEQKNILVFSFFNILLPDSTTSLAGSNGYVRFDIELSPDLAPGTPIENSAAIYFDYNEPIITNTTMNVLTATRNPDALALQFSVFPNPGRQDLNLTAELEEYSERIVVDLYDLQGRRVLQKQWAGGFSPGPLMLALPVPELSTGTYFIQLSTNNRTGVSKWTKW
ncbi:DUF7619 domain-containing protein [Neolewinella agarilytica]|uniref:Conserved repeat domain-containing protein/Por secretion system C-terminal sorting domain-containing protein n=1 Tax=Neolewinella agarilytica TaxID=478744 RepID=A0A1H9HG41_9BACT|nr:T9SS type A sorting domain-containing protein [Neolewinella agarilytica]SEQ61277.1 conserved repeat domain-containing protein/Por secretion system C-terminal sorting domain-containing protein [Neolewinella agarilytica]